MWKMISLLLLTGCATINEDCVGVEDYDLCVQEERAVRKRMERDYSEAQSKACRQAGGVMYCEERAGRMDCQCMDKLSVQGIFR